VNRLLLAPAWNGIRRGHLLRAIVLLGFSFGAAAIGLPQSRPYYYITSIEARQLNNAVILTIKGDGAMTDIHAHDYSVVSNGSPFPTKTIELHCSNAKSQVGDFVDVSKYPISHVELQPRSYANDGIGLGLYVKLYTEARIRHFHTERFSGDWGWSPTQGCCFDGELGRDQQSFVLTVVSDRFAEPGATAERPENQQFQLEPGPEGTYSLWALNLDLRRLADELGRRTGTRIVVDESVTRNVTVHLPEMTVRQLLGGIAAGYGLAVEDADGQYVLSKGLPANVATYETNVTQVVKLEHLSPEAALDLLPNFLLAYAKPSEAQNALIVAGPEQLVRRVREDVAKIDQPPRQLRIEIAAVKIADTQASQQAFAAEVGEGRQAFALDSFSGSLSYQRLGQPTEEVRARLRRLEQRGAVSTLAKAHVTLVNGRWARLFLGQTQYIQVTRNTEYGDDQIAIPVNLGVEVSLGAWTGGEGIALWLHPTVTTLGGVDPVSELPIVDRYETTGALIVPDRHTLLLGGVRLSYDTGQGRRTAGLIAPYRTGVLENAEIALFITARDLGEFDDSGQPAFTGRMARELRDAGLQLEYKPLAEQPAEAPAPN
jgi:type II secretory pathway component GspD/PulD (secretin)